MWQLSKKLLKQNWFACKNHQNLTAVNFFFMNVQAWKVLKQLNKESLVDNCNKKNHQNLNSCQNILVRINTVEN